jgi:hypothetical protein
MNQSCVSVSDTLPCAGVGPYDQRSIASREDVLTYTTSVLSQTVVSGPVTARITLLLDQPGTTRPFLKQFL